MGQENILHPQVFYSHASFLSSDSMTAKNINTTTVRASALSAEYHIGNVFTSSSPSVTATFFGKYYGDGWDLESTDKGQFGVNSWVRSNSSTATGYVRLSSKTINADFIGTNLFKTQAATTILTNTTLGSATFHGVYYGDGWNLEGVDRSQPTINSWVRANSSIATNYVRLSSKTINADFIGTELFKTESAATISTNTALGSATFHGIYYGNGWELEGIDKEQPVINSWVRSNSSIDTLGTLWFEITAGLSNVLTNKTQTVYGNGNFVTVSYDLSSDNIAISDDGKNWRTVTAPTSALTHIAYGNGVFVAVSDLNSSLPENNQIVTSSDGINWERGYISTHSNWQRVVYGNGIFVAISDDFVPRVIISNNGITWKQVIPTGGTPYDWKSICYAHGMFVLVASDSWFTSITTTTDFITWTSVQSFGESVTFTDIIYGNELFILTTKDSTDRYYSSKDGITWDLNVFPTIGENWECKFSEGLFTAVCTVGGISSYLYTSRDGLVWTERLQTNSATELLNSVAYGNGVIVVNSYGKVYVSGRTRNSNEPNSNIRHGNNILYGTQTVTGLISAAGGLSLALSAGSPSVSFVVENNGELQTRFLSASIIPQYTFTKNLTVSLGGAKTFGRYVNGDIIPAIGKTTPQVLELALIEPITPDASIAGTGPTITFNQTAITNNLTLTYKLCSLGASVDLAATKLVYSRDNTTYATITSWSSTPANSLSYTHNFTDPLTFSGATTLAGSNVTPYYYKYTVTDTAGATRTVSTNVTPQTYSAPSISPTALTTTRYKGDIASTYTGTLTRNSANIALSSYQIQRNVSGSGYVNRSSLIYITTNPASTGVTFSDNDATIVNATSVAYRLMYTDLYVTTKGFGPQVATSSTTSTVNFVHKNVYFASTLASLTLADIDAVPVTATSTLSGALLVSPVSKARTISSVNTSSTQYIYYVYDAALGNLTSIMQNINTDVTTAFVLQANVTGNNLNGAAVTYIVYRSNAQGPYMSSQPSLTFS